MTDFIKSLGTPYLAHVMRRLYDNFVKDIDLWYAEIGVTSPARTHSTMVLLAKEGPLGVTEVAARLRQSHPLVLTWVAQLKKLGLVQASHDPLDGRRTLLSLTEAGKVEVEKNREADRLVGEAYRNLMKESDAPIFDALWRIEKACQQKRFLRRIRDIEQSSTMAHGSLGPCQSKCTGW